MKHRKNSKKNAYRGAYTPGRNVFGEKAETHLIVLKRETAFEQIMDAIMTFDGSNKEYTFDMRCFAGHEDEFALIEAKVNSFLEMLSKAA